MNRRVASVVVLVVLAALGTASVASAAGALDASFSHDGWLRTLEVRTATNNYLPEGVEDFAIQPDGKVVAVGELEDGVSNWYFGVFRYTARGELDTSFGEGGWAHTDLGSFDFAHAVALQEDGKIVVGGESDWPRASCFTLARYTSGGALDTTFGGGDGVVRTMFSQCGCSVYDLAIQPNGKIVAAGGASGTATHRTTICSPSLDTFPTDVATRSSRGTAAPPSISATATTSREPSRSSPTGRSSSPAWAHATAT